MPSTRNLGRYREIAAVLALHGFGWLLAESKLRDLLPIGEKVGEGIVELTEFGLALLRHLTRIAAQLERGELGAHVELRGVDRHMAEMQRMVNRLAMSIIVGALIIGLSLFMHMVTPEGFVERYAGQFFGLLFLAVTGLGSWLLLSLVRSGRR